MIPELLTEIPIEQAGRFVMDDRYAMQRKRDGIHLVVSTLNALQIREGFPPVEFFNKRGEPCSGPRWLAQFMPPGVIFDGELEGNAFHVFDVLACIGYGLIRSSSSSYLGDCPYSERLASTQVFGDHPLTLSPDHPISFVPTWYSAEDKERELYRAAREHWEGVVFKRLDAPYRPGRAGQHFKLKFTKTCTVRVRSVEPRSARVEMLKCTNCTNRTILPTWHEVCGVSLVGRPAVKVGDYLEVKYLYASTDLRLVQPVMLRLRDDVTDADCSTAQLILKGES